MRFMLVGVWLLAISSAPAYAQSDGMEKAGPREVLPLDEEVALARSAAPAMVSSEATVLVWNGTGFETGVEGTNGVTCYVGRAWPVSREPQCFDEEGSRTILPIELRRMELRHQGRTESEVDATIAAGLHKGQFQLPRRPAMTYMMSGGQQLYNDEGRAAGRWESHLMIYYPYLTERDLGLGMAPSTEAAILVGSGTPLSNIMIVLKSFVEVEPAEPPPEQAPNDEGP